MPRTPDTLNQPVNHGTPKQGYIFESQNVSHSICMPVNRQSKNILKIAHSQNAELMPKSYAMYEYIVLHSDPTELSYASST